MSAAPGFATRRRALLLVLLAAPLAGCSGVLQRLGEVGEPPRMAPTADPTKEAGYHPLTMPEPTPRPVVPEANSLWRPNARAFFADQRAAAVGDIITVVVNITDTADVKDASNATRNGTDTMGISNLFGLNTIPHLLGKGSPTGLVNTASNTVNTAIGEIARNETITLRLAGLVTQVLPNGNFVVAARQQVRVNSELRELVVSGVVRPQDIASDNTVQHDRMAEARISYGGRGQLTDVQTPRYGQQALDILLPF